MMGSSTDRSINSGMSLPQWMKTKMFDSRYDIEESFSPPTHDDSFFYIRYPKPGGGSPPPPAEQEGNYRTINSLIQKEKPQDFSKHTPPCKKFISQAHSTLDDSKDSVITKQKMNKSQGTDDGYKGEGAACGKSVVQVAQQMISSGSVVGLRIPEEEEDTSYYDFNRRRGSKSLPASPLTTPTNTPQPSPRIMRKMAANRYFTGSFVVAETAGNKNSGSWLLSGLMGSSAMSVVSEEGKEINENQSDLDELNKSPLRRNKSTSALINRIKAETGKEEKVIQAKPSELREMNFWSPTSM